MLWKSMNQQNSSTGETPQGDFAFSGLSPDTVLDALETCGIYPESGLLALNSYENRVYQFKAEDGQRLVVKFYRPGRWTDEQILEEHAFALELAGADIPLVAPLAIDGKTMQQACGFRFAVFPSVGGRQFEVDNLDQIEWMGRFIGRIHRVAQAKPFVHRPELNTQSFLDAPRDVLTRSRLLPSHLETAFFAILDPLIKETRQRYHNSTLIRLRVTATHHRLSPRPAPPQGRTSGSRGSARRASRTSRRSRTWRARPSRRRASAPTPTGRASPRRSR